MKASLDMNSMKEFATNHVEKFVFWGIVLLLLLFAVQALRTVSKGPPFTPAELKAEAGRARENISRTTWADYRDKNGALDFPKYLDVADDFFKEIPGPIYEFPPGAVLDPRIFPPRNKRDVPKLIALEGLRAVGGNGALQMTGGPGAMPVAGAMPMAGEPGARAGGRGAQGKRWVVVTGLLPFKEQLDAFNAEFQDAMFRNPQRDIPTYVGYWLERAEVSASGPAQEPDWKPIALRDAFGAIRYWGGAGGREVVHQKFLPRRPPQGLPAWPMVFPLPPRINAPWGPEVARPPEIPLLIDMPLQERGMGYPGQPLAALEGEVTEGAEAKPGEGEDETVGPEGLDPFGLGLPGAPGAGRATAYPGAAPMMPGGGAMPMMPGAGGAYPGAMYPGGGAYPGAMYPGGGYSDDESYMYEDSMQPGAMPYGRRGMVSRVEDIPKYQLFRFFDFEVEPGRRYQYRVRLGLYNPNYGVESRFLANEDLGKVWWVQTDWSEPSNVVKVPRDSRLLAGTVKPPREQPGVYVEPTVDVIAVTLREQDGVEASEKYTVYRGHLANFVAELDQQKAPGPYGMPGMPGAYDDMMMGSGAMYAPGDMPGAPARPARKPAAKKAEEEVETINHATGLIVLDLAGGDRLHRTDRSLTEPGSLLLVDPDGNLVVQSELDDAEEFTKFFAPEEPRGAKRKAKPGEGMYPPGYEGGMEDMYDGMMYGEEGPARRGRRPRRSRDDT